MSITIKIVEIVDKLKLNHYFVQKNNSTYFRPITIKLNTDLIEKAVDKVMKAKGKSYKPSQLEKDVLKELDF